MIWPFRFRRQEKPLREGYYSTDGKRRSYELRDGQWHVNRGGEFVEIPGEIAVIHEGEKVRILYNGKILGEPKGHINSGLLKRMSK